MAQNSSETEENKNFGGQLSLILKRLEDLDRRLRSLEQNRGVEAPQRKTFEVSEEVRQSSPAFAPQASEQKKRSGESLEANVTGKVFPVVGILAIFFGAGFFLKYIFERNLIGPVGKVAIEAFAGFGLVALGQFLFKKENHHGKFVLIQIVLRMKKLKEGKGNLRKNYKVERLK